MDPTFWWNWWINAAVAFGTISAVIVALFGQAFRDKFFPPRLTLRLVTADGELTIARAAGATETRVRYYHLRVANSRSWSPATEVQVFLLQVEEPGPSGEFRPIWIGDVPFGWRHQVISPLARTIGSEFDIDLCSVTETGIVQFYVLLTPNNIDL